MVDGQLHKAGGDFSIETQEQFTLKIHLPVVRRLQMKGVETDRDFLTGGLS